MGNGPFVCALDSGGSKTLCWILAADGTVLAKELGTGAANIHDEAVVRGHLAPVIETALKTSGLSLEQISAVNITLGGLNEVAIQKVTQGLLPVASIHVHRESTGASVCAGAPFWGFDIALMAGTGVVAVGLNQANGLQRACGGWGYLMHDLGSGFSIGQRALQALAESIDIRKYPTTLLQAVAKVPPFQEPLKDCSFLEKSTVEMTYEERQVVKNLLKSAIPQLDRRTIAGLFPVVCQCAAAGDGVSLKILAQATEMLASITCALAEDLQLTAPRVTPIGGIFKAGEIIAAPYKQALGNLMPDASLIFTDFTQIYGSALLALKLANISLSNEIVDNIRATAK